MTDPEVVVRAYKPVQLDGGTLVVSIPHGAIANLLLTDFLLEQRRMDQVAALDSPAFPPFAMVHRGKARFPMRLHADPVSRLAVLRCEFAPPPSLARPIAAAILDWARVQGLARVVATDVLHALPGGGPPGAAVGEDAGADPEELPGLWFSASSAATRREALRAGLTELREGVLDGVSAVLLLEARFRGADVVGLFTERRDLVDETRGAHVLAHALRSLVPGLDLDLPALEERLAEVEAGVRQARDAAELAMDRLRGPEPAAGAPPMYG